MFEKQNTLIIYIYSSPIPTLLIQYYSLGGQGWECLNEYVHRDDGSLDWRLLEARLEVEDYEGRGGWTAYYLNMTSQVTRARDT